MALRMVEIIIPEGYKETIEAIMKDRPRIDYWYEKIQDNKILARILIQAEESEALMDLLESRFTMIDEFRIVIIPVEAALPRPTAAKEEKIEEKEIKEEKKIKRISREELYSDIVDTSRLTKGYVILVILSAIVAAIGILKESVVVIIGAMVIAPLLGPNVALSLATALGDIHLARNALWANLVGILIALAVASLVGVALSVDPSIPGIASKTEIGLEDIGVAMASGSAGALAFTIGISAALVGVMLAVALLPPLVTLGLLIGSGHASLAFDALSLFAANLICINLAGVVTFFTLGVRPISWWEANKARKATFLATTLWILLLIILIILLITQQG